MRILTVLSKYLAWGGSWVVIVPPRVREHLQFRPGDIVEWNIVGQYAVLQRWTPAGIPWRDPKQIAAALAEKAPSA